MPQGPAAIPIGVPTGWLPVESHSVMDVHVNAVIVGVLSGHRSKPECSFIVLGTIETHPICVQAKAVEIKVFLDKFGGERWVERHPLDTQALASMPPLFLFVAGPGVEPRSIRRPDEAARVEANLV